jgi:hypothetical protein
MAADRSNGAKSSRILDDGVSGVLDAWLPDDLEGSDAVRASVCKRLAAELDDPGLPAHAIARLASTLITVVTALDAKHEFITPGKPPTREQLSRLLDLVNDVKE